MLHQLFFKNKKYQLKFLENIIRERWNPVEFLTDIRPLRNILVDVIQYEKQACIIRT
jgi:hypothetical protein